MIEVENLSRQYGDLLAVSGVSFSAKSGDILGFLGPNGAGKTTTLRMLVTYLPPSSGTARVAGYDILRESDSVRRNIGYLPESPPLYGEMTVTEYLSFVAQLKGIYGRKKIREAVERAIERCFLMEVSKRLCRNLSRGYRQRVGLAQAIVHDPSVIVLDEPTSGLDPKQITEIRRLIKELGKDRTVILSTHILPEVQMVCNRVVIISRGKIALESNLEDLTKEKSLEQVFLESVGYEDVSDKEITGQNA
ncbi:MAG: ATP-binding cassette domain-containing protein [Candidatus Dadabacteria bacterium]|nr:MAG: ATP-binding cassette domain-containing protein [Candidatus Dadabacteria bacterium]